jgi:hypothetical protein
VENFVIIKEIPSEGEGSLKVCFAPLVHKFFVKGRFPQARQKYPRHSSHSLYSVTSMPHLAHTCIGSSTTREQKKQKIEKRKGEGLREREKEREDKEDKGKHTAVLAGRGGEIRYRLR